jgi:hypothetical protein
LPDVLAIVRAEQLFAQCVWCFSPQSYEQSIHSQQFDHNQRHEHVGIENISPVVVIEAIEHHVQDVQRQIHIHRSSQGCQSYKPRLACPIPYLQSVTLAMK